MDTIELRKCKRCGDDKPLTDFVNPTIKRPCLCAACKATSRKESDARKHKRRWSNEEYRLKKKLDARFRMMLSRGVKCTKSEFMHLCVLDRVYDIVD